MNENIHIIVFTGRHPVLSFFIKQFLKFLDEKSIDHYLVNADDPSTYNCDAFDKYAAQPDTVVFMFNNIGAGLKASDDESFWKIHNIPVFNCLVDHPRNFGDTLRNPICDIYAFALDPDHITFMKEHYPLLKGIFFSPNGGTDFHGNIPYTDRKIDVLYAGSCQPAVDSYPVVNLFSDNGADYYYQTILYMLNDPSLSTDDAIALYLKTNNINLSEEEKYYLITLTSNEIEHTLRHKTKLEGIKALDEAGVHVEIFGSSWIDPEYPFSDNITIHEWIDINDLLPMICNAKISLCFIPWFKKGCSEKNFDAMLNGSLCVTDSSDYLRKNYKDGYNLIFFDLNNPAQMAADVKWLLDNPQTAAAIAAKGYETASKYDTWDNRFEDILAKMFEVIAGNT